MAAAAAAEAVAVAPTEGRGWQPSVVYSVVRVRKLKRARARTRAQRHADAMSADDNHIMTQSLSARGWRVWRGRGGKREARECSSEPQSSSLALLAASLAKMDCRCSSVCCSEVFFNLFWSNPLRVAFESASPVPVWPVRVACQLVLFLRAHLSRGSRGQKHSKEQPSRTCLAARFVARK